MKCTLHIYTVPSVDWYHHWRNRSSSFGGEANTNYYPSAKIICDEQTDARTDGQTDGRTDGWTDRHADHYMATLRGHNYLLPFGEFCMLTNYFSNIKKTVIFLGMYLLIFTWGKYTKSGLTVLATINVNEDWKQPRFIWHKMI